MKNYIKKIAIIALLTLSPIFAHAGGVSLYFVKSSVVQDVSFEDYRYDIDPISVLANQGFGLAFKTNVNKQNIFGYHLNLEYLDNMQSDTDAMRVNMLHTFAFGVVKKPMFRLWIGPRINLSYGSRTLASASNPFGDYESKMRYFGVGIAPAIGVDITFKNRFGLFADLDYRVSVGVGTIDADTSTNEDETDHSYSYGETGFSYRFGINFIFGETRT